MTDADRELAALLKRNPELRVLNAPDPTAAIAQAHATITATLADNAQPLEDEMQAAVIAWAAAQPHPALPWLFHPANGEYRTPATAAKLKTMGVRAGVPDLILPWSHNDYPGLVIEMKRKPNRPTPEQEAWLEHFRKQGWWVAVCYSADEAIWMLREYLDIAE